MTQSRFADEDTLAHIAELEALVAQQAAVIEQMRTAIRECGYDLLARSGPGHKEVRAALTITTSPEVLNKVRADAVREFVKPYSDSHTYIGIAIKKEAECIAKRIEKGEA